MGKKVLILSVVVTFFYVCGFSLDFDKGKYVLFSVDGLFDVNIGAGNFDNVYFSDEYIEENRGKFRVEIPEVHELINIMIAISTVGLVDSNMINNRTSYHKDVLEHFLPFKDHPAIHMIEQQITLGYNGQNSINKKELMNSYQHYNAWKMNACGYLFDKHGSIVDDGIIHRMGSRADPIKHNLKLIEDFALKTDFRTFYKNNNEYYNDLLTTYRQLNPIDKMKSWLENQFGMEYGNYRVTFSPLVGGSHSTKRYSDNGFEQTVMFVSKANYHKRYSKALNEMIASRVVFTEINHNFVNPISDVYASQINKAFSNRNNWVNSNRFGTNGYKTPYKVFNEYMTWGIFSLYAHDNFLKDDVDIFLQRMEHQMENKRGFIHFKAFNRKLLSLYQNKPKDQKVFELYSELLNWCSEQNELFKSNV